MDNNMESLTNCLLEDYCKSLLNVYNICNYYNVDNKEIYSINKKFINKSQLIKNCTLAIKHIDEDAPNKDLVINSLKQTNRMILLKYLPALNIIACLFFLRCLNSKEIGALNRRKKAIFRGVCKREYTLCPNLYRKTSPIFKNKHRVYITKNYLDKFYQTEVNIDIVAKFQHNSKLTPLLDFSKNLYTAISFGTNYGLGEQCDSCYLYIVDNIKNTADNCMLEEMTVYCTNGQIKANEIIFDKPFATLSLKDIKPEVYIVDNVFKNNRQIKQEGVFMFVKKGIFINQTLLWPRYKTRNKGNLCYADISASNFKKLKSVRELLK